MSATKRGLGRGLDALLQPASAATRQVPVVQLVANRRQPRRDFDDASLAELAASIRAQGLVQPIVVTPAGDGRYTIVAGERRWRAAQLAGLGEVPVVVREVADDRELLELALVENLQRTDLNPIEEALAYRSLREEFELSQEEIARRVGKARPTVANSLRLLNLAESVQGLVRAGRLSAGQARPLLGLPLGEQERLAERAAGEGLTARQLERLVARAGEGAEPAPAAEPDVHTAAAVERLTRRLQTRVEIRRRRRGGEVRIHFGSEDELIRLFELLTTRGRS